MGGPRIAVRILGVTSTTRGCAFATIENHNRLVDWAVSSIPPSEEAAFETISKVLRKMRPLFIALDRLAGAKKRTRGKAFDKALERASADRRIMILSVDRRKAASGRHSQPNRWDIAEEMAKRFPEIAHKLPSRRKPWQSDDDRIGLFLALAAATVAWEQFGRPHK